MRLSKKSIALVAALCELSGAYPSLGGETESLEKRWDGFSNDLSVRIPPYKAPGPNDSRGPCPGLNTLANHGLINRNGKNLNSSDILKAFPRGFGINMNGFFTALHNFEVVCEYVNGVTCGTPENDGTFILTNLTLLGEPHTFEHDHSFSREDYRQKYAHGGITDNIYFNSTIMQKSLNVVNKYKTSNPPKVKRANYQDFNQIRLQRESQQNIDDFAGWFQQNIPPTLFETGFIFGATFDRDSKGNMIGTTPSVRLDWWDFWFREESFPTQLGWVPAHTSVFDINFITSVSKAVLAAPITSTPKSLPPGATNSVQDPAGNLPEAGPAVTFPLFGGPPYAAPTQPAAITPAKNKRDAAPQAASTTTSDEEVTAASVLSSVASKVSEVPAILASATSIVGSAPPKFNFYEQTLDASSVSAQVAVAQSYESAVIAAITSLAGP
ncbi:hypothetical protein KC331_g8853 [Hortaea werneckii]|nr:hypothetical protein KC331_g8853 [Hortaea werneckii]KAI7709308.1 hypothetical protein KC353_g10453 [Hortaea werneckii]